MSRGPIISADWHRRSMFTRRFVSYLTKYKNNVRPFVRSRDRKRECTSPLGEVFMESLEVWEGPPGAFLLVGITDCGSTFASKPRAPSKVPSKYLSCQIRYLLFCQCRFIENLIQSSSDVSGGYENDSADGCSTNDTVTARCQRSCRSQGGSAIWQTHHWASFGYLDQGRPSPRDQSATE